MSVPESLASLCGDWKGKNRLNLAWLPDPIRESDSKASVSLRSNRQCLEIAYTWAYEGEPHEGLIILCGNGRTDSMNAVWTDSWHSANVLMLCGGTVDKNGRLNVMGHYGVPDHPDWGWRTEIIANDSSFKYFMFNISPEGIEEWAVESEFTRA
jgi:hypothetical protein